jgi:hypothetical protein
MPITVDAHQTNLEELKVPGNPAFDEELKNSRIDAGLPIKEYEYGVKYPDGTIKWANLFPAQSNLSVEEGRWYFLNQWNQAREQLHQVNEGTLTFVRRIVTQSFSTPIEILSPIDPREKHRAERLATALKIVEELQQ